MQYCSLMFLLFNGIQRFGPTEEELKKRKELRDRIMAALQGLCIIPSRIGLLDTSLSHYAVDVASAPLEFVIQVRFLDKKSTYFNIKS